MCTNTTAGWKGPTNTNNNNNHDNNNDNDNTYDNTTTNDNDDDDYYYYHYYYYEGGRDAPGLPVCAAAPCRGEQYLCISIIIYFINR